MSDIELRNKHNSKSGFTLAEVLITLGIIGVVAAMTLPALMANSRKQEVISRLKKFNTTISQSILLSVNDNGPYQYWNKETMPTIKDDEGNNILDDSGSVQYDDNIGSKQSYDFFMKYFAPYIKYTKIEEKAQCILNNEINGKRTKVYFADGSTACIKNGGCIDFNYDINGDRKPNMSGQDQFYFVFCPQSSKAYFNGNVVFGAYFPVSWGTNDREKVYKECEKAGAYCLRLIELDGWEIKKDYPHKI